MSAPFHRVRLAPMSDLHHEHRTHFYDPMNYRENGADIAVLAGDIDTAERAIDYCARIGKPAVYVPGNHENYGRDIHEARATLAEKAAEQPLVHLLDPGVTVIEVRGTAVRFIGATLWTDYCLFGVEDQVRAMQDARMGMNDHRLIQNGFDPFLPQDALELHRQQRAFIEAELAKPHDGPTVAVTHHAPSIRAQDAKYATSKVAPAFCSDLETLVAASGADVWICGHTHGGCDVMLGETRLVSNQHGYRGELAVEMKTVDL